MIKYAFVRATKITKFKRLAQLAPQKDLCPRIIEKEWARDIDTDKGPLVPLDHQLMQK